MDLIEKFFEKKLITNKNTQHSYEQGINYYFKTIKKNPETYFHNGHDIEQDITTYYLSLKKKNYAPWTQRVKLNAIKQFLTTFDKEIKQYEIWETISLRLRGADGIIEETPLDKTDIKKILQYGDIGSKAMFLIMASTGCRIEAIVGIEPEDIRINEEPVRIVFRPEIVKGKKKTITSFLTPEAVEAYKAWLKIRDKYLESAVKRTTFKHGKKTTNDNRVFPMCDVNARLIWKNIATKAGYGEKDKKTGRLKAHPGSLRKFFRSYLGNADLAEHLMGHSGYLSTYRKYDYVQLGKEYLKYVDNLSIFESPDISEIHEQMKEKESRIKQLEEQIQTKNIAQEIIGNPAFRAEMMNLLKKEMEKD